MLPFTKFIKSSEISSKQTKLHLNNFFYIALFQSRILSNSSLSDYERISQRVFLDTNIVHCLVRYGEEIFDNQDVLLCDTLSRNKDGTQNVESLRNLFGFSRSNFRLVISPNVIKEVTEKDNVRYEQYVYDLKDYCDMINEYDGTLATFHDKNQQILEQFNSKIGFLSNDDKKLIFDAIRFQCNYFMTMDEKLMKNKNQVKNFTGITLIRPFEFWDLVRPYIGLIA